MPPALIDIFTPVFFGLINELRPSNQQNTKHRMKNLPFRTDVHYSMPSYLLEVLWGQPIKLIQVFFTLEFSEYR